MEDRVPFATGKFIANQLYYHVIHIGWRQTTSMLVQTWSYDGLVSEDHPAKTGDIPNQRYRFALVAMEAGEWTVGTQISFATLKEASHHMLTATELVERLQWFQDRFNPDEKEPPA